MGKGGIDIIPSDERSAPAPPSHLAGVHGNSESLTRTSDITNTAPALTKLFPRETGEDIGMGSPVPLSSEAVGVITRLRNMKVSLLFCFFMLIQELSECLRTKLKTGAVGGMSFFALRAI